MIVAELIGTATPEKKGLMSAKDKNLRGCRTIDVTSNKVFKIANLENNNKSGYIDLTLVFTPQWETSSILKICIAIHTDNYLDQNVHCFKIMGDTNKLKLYVLNNILYGEILYSYKVVVSTLCDGYVNLDLSNADVDLSSAQEIGITG